MTETLVLGSECKQNNKAEVKAIENGRGNDNRYFPVGKNITFDLCFLMVLGIY